MSGRDYMRAYYAEHADQYRAYYADRYRRQAAERRATRKAREEAAAKDDDPPATAEELAQLDRLRPRCRSECRGGPRPCPWVGCRYHLMLDVHGRSILAARARMPETMRETCALDVAERGGLSIAEIAELLDLSTTRVGQIELCARAHAQLGYMSIGEYGSADEESYTGPRAEDVDPLVDG